MTTEDNYNKPDRTIADWIAEGYTEAYARALYAQQNRADAKKLIAAQLKAWNTTE
jgi:hypothetical protein